MTGLVVIVYFGDKHGTAPVKSVKKTFPYWSLPLREGESVNLLDGWAMFTINRVDFDVLLNQQWIEIRSNSGEGQVEAFREEGWELREH